MEFRKVRHPPLTPFPGRIQMAIILTGILVGIIMPGMLFPDTAQGAVGELIVLRGQATVIRGNRTIIVRRRYILEAEDRVRTGPDGKVQLRYYAPLRGSGLIATRDTEFVVRDLIPRRRKGHLLRLVWGAVRSRLAAFSRRRPFLQTGTAVIGVKGTDFIVYVKKKNASEFIGVEGLIEAVSRSRPEFSIRIGRRQWGEIVEGEKPKPPIRVPDELWFSALEEFSFPGEPPPSG